MSMKNGRSIGDVTDIARKYNISTDPPPPDAMFWKLWNRCRPIADLAYNTAFLQGIAAGTLDPTTYGSFNIRDVYYCTHGADDYGVAAARSVNQVLTAYLLKKQASYNKYNQTLLQTWSLSGPDSIAPGLTVLNYANLESQVAKGDFGPESVDPIYAMIVMIPCEYLWAWLAMQLPPPVPGNLYASWKTDNDDPSGAYAMGNFLETYRQTTPVSFQYALSIYLSAMECEYHNFNGD